MFGAVHDVLVEHDISHDFGCQKKPPKHRLCYSGLKFEIWQIFREIIAVPGTSRRQGSLLWEWFPCLVLFFWGVSFAQGFEGS